MKRIQEDLLHSYLRSFPCVALIGVRQCGKTTLLGSLPADWKRYDLERRADYQVVARDPDLFLRLNPRHVAFDEAQVLPEIFPALRVAIDEHRHEKGRFVITGSSSPALIRSVSEALSGRVAIINMSPLSWEEITGTVGRDSLLRRLTVEDIRPPDLIHGLGPRGDLDLMHTYWLRGGYPEPWVSGSDEFREQWTEQYIQTYLYRDIKRLFPGLDEHRFARFLELLGGLSGRVLNYADVARALGISQPTARQYFGIAHGTFLWRTVPVYSHDPLRHMVRHPRGYLRDSGLLHSLLHIPNRDRLLAHPQMGSSWEGMVIEEVFRQLNGMGRAYYGSYYRTRGGAEVDLVVESGFGTVAFEVKYTQSVDGRELRGLKDFVVRQNARVGVVVNNDVTVRVYDERIIGVPFAFL